jgi:predicted ATPase
LESFKSLYELTAHFDSLSVLTGANGAGKSNLVDGLTFIANTYQHGLEFAVSHGGGYENIAHRRTRRAKRPVRVAIDVEVTASEIRRTLRHIGRNQDKGSKKRKAADPPLRIRHEFSFHTASQKLTADFAVLRERLSVYTVNGEEIASITRRADGLDVHRGRVSAEVADLVEDMLLTYEREEFRNEMKLAPSELFIDRRFYVDLFWYVTRYLSSIRVFQISPHTSRVSGVASPRAQLALHGENLPGAADFLRRNQPDAWQRVESAMRSIIPTLEEVIIVYTEDRRLAVQFRERGVGRPWNAGEVSDGTIQTLALLVAIFDERSSMLVIEELENALHPWILRQLVNLCIESPRQILLTTHSPVLLNLVDPRSVQLMWMDEGRSFLAPLLQLDPEIARQVIDGELNLFELYDSGVVPQALPRGLGGIN